ncbi:MAG: nucleoside-diphosphate kinase, partial [Candidatus Limnocylindrales bacterium]
MADLQRTLLLVKPDGVQRLLVGRVLTRFEERGLKLVGLKLVWVDRALAEQHYAVHR